jgi:hypothetical protein
MTGSATGWRRGSRLFHLPGKVVRHAGALVLKIAAEFVELFRDIRRKSWQLAQAFTP